MPIKLINITTYKLIKEREIKPKLLKVLHNQHKTKHALSSNLTPQHLHSTTIMLFPSPINSKLSIVKIKCNPIKIKSYINKKDY